MRDRGFGEKLAVAVPHEDFSVLTRSEDLFAVSGCGECEARTVERANAVLAT